MNIISKRKNINGELGYYYEVIKNYKVDNSKLGRSIELDGLATGLGKSKNRLLVIECKYRNKPFSLSMYEHLKESVSIFPFEFYDIYLFSKAGFTNDMTNLNNNNVHLITLDEIDIN